MRHPKNKRCEVCGDPSARTICSFCQSNHCPVPEHHVAAERPCLRCPETFNSAWAGERICPRCRELDRLVRLNGNAIDDVSYAVGAP